MSSLSISSYYFLVLHSIYPHYFYSHISFTHPAILDIFNSNFGIVSMHLSPIPWFLSPIPLPQRNNLLLSIFKPFNIPTSGLTILIRGSILEPSERISKNQKGKRYTKGRKSGITSHGRRTRARQQVFSKDQQDKLSS